MNRGPAVECYDVGGTQVRGAIVTADGIEAVVVEKSARGDAAALFAQIESVSRRLGARKTAALAVALPGPVTGTVLTSSRPLELETPTDFAAGLDKLRGSRRLFVGNDLNFAVRAELKRGAGREHKNFVLLTLSTGIGAGVVLDSRIVARRIEVRHSVLEPDPGLANDCQGHRGCWVAQASGAGIEATLARAGKALTAKEFFDSPDLSILARVRRYNTQGIGNLVNAYDPEAVIVMGSIGRHQFRQVIPTARELEAFTALRPIPPVEQTTFGDDIGLLGAYEAAADQIG